MKRLGLIEKIKRQILGYDIFISYSRKDSISYAYAVAKYFIDKGYECYIDQISNAQPGGKISKKIVKAIQRSHGFVLIGSDGAQESKDNENGKEPDPILQEIDVFFANNDNKFFKPINIEYAINVDNAKNNDPRTTAIERRILGLSFEFDSKENLLNGFPDRQMLNKIESALTFTKKSKRLRNISILTLFSVLIILSSALGYSFSEIRKAKIKTNLALANENRSLIKAESAELRSNVAKREEAIARMQADSLNADLANKRIQLDSTIREVHKLTVDAKCNYLTAQSARYIDKNPTLSFEYLTEAAKIGNNQEMTSIFHALLENRAICKLSLTRKKNVNNICINKASTNAAILFDDSLLYVDLLSYKFKSFNIIKGKHANFKKVRILDDGRLLIAGSSLEILNTNDGQITVLDTLNNGNAEYITSAQQKYCFIFDRWADSLELCNLCSHSKTDINKLFRLRKIENVFVSDKGSFSVISSRDSSYIVDSNINILAKFKNIGRVFFSPDEKYFVGLLDGQLTLYSFRKNKINMIHNDNVSKYSSVVFSDADSKYFYTVEKQAKIYWKIDDEALWYDPQNPFLFTKKSSYFPSELVLEDNNINIHNNYSNSNLAIKDFEGDVTNAIFFDNWQQLIATSKFNEIKIFSLASLKPYQILDTGGNKQFVTIRNRLLLFDQQTVQTVDLNSKKQLSKTKLQYRFRRVYCNTAEAVYYEDTGSNLICYYTTTGKTVKISSTPIKEFVKYDEQGGKIFFTGKSPGLYEYNMKKNELARLFPNKGDYIFSEDNKLVACYFNDRIVNWLPVDSTTNTSTIDVDLKSAKIVVFDVDTKKRLYTFNQKRSYVKYLNFNNLNQLVLGLLDTNLNVKHYVLDNTGKTVKSGHDYSSGTDFQRIKYTKNENLYTSNIFAKIMVSYIFYAFDFLMPYNCKSMLYMNKQHSNEAIFWNSYTNRTCPISLDHGEDIRFYKFNNRYQSIIICSIDGHVYIFDLNTRKRKKIQDQIGEADDVVISNSGKYFATLDRFERINLYSVDGSLISSLNADSGYQFAFTNDDNYLIIKNKQNEISFWPLNLQTIN